MYRSRLAKKLDEKAAAFISSLDEDRRIFEEDIDGTEAHDIMLREQGIIEKKILGRFLAPLKKSVKAGELVNLKREIGMRTYTNS